ncbi:MAG TPA: carbonic anhydrase [Acidobacteriaceae bacterium]|jgi:carbonic anhydrase|nr:carbonic anhydrase [Acidobacteriaceae bacterium]
MHRLLEGYARFRTSVFPKLAPEFERLSHGQSPEALLITCSDSRVMPEMLLQSDPGVVFPIRVAGNLVPPPGNDPSGIAATIEYAVRVLKVSEVIVCGHSGCGAIKELLEQAHANELPDVTSWLSHAGVSAKWLRGTFTEIGGMSPERQLALMTEANVLTQLDHLRHHAAVRDGLREHKLRLHGWVYEIATGEIRSFDDHTGRFEPLDAKVTDLLKRVA